MVQSHKLKKILITGGSSRFCEHLKKTFVGKNIFYPNKKKLNILKYENILKFVKKKRITHIIHIAGLSRPMKVHETKINSSIDLNIIGTANVVKVAFLKKIKVIYFSTNYVYQGSQGNYKETDPVFPVNSYAWSKLGGECAVRLLKNYLILRLCMTDFPFVHKKAVYDAYTSFIFNKEIAKILPYLIDLKGTLNVGGKKRSVKIFSKKIAKLNLKKISYKKINFPKDSSINIENFKKILKRKKLKKIIL